MRISTSEAMLFVFVALLATANAHRSIPVGTTCSNQFNSPEDALRLPNSKISWASRRIFTCDQPVFWLEADVEKDQLLAFTVTVPVIERFADVRMSVAFIGPGLPDDPEYAYSNETIPTDVFAYQKDTANMGNGLGLWKSPRDQSTCQHLNSTIMARESDVVNERCHFYEPFGGSNSWVVMDELLKAPETATYKIAVFVEDGTTAKATFAGLDWPEDFTTDYGLPESTCPFCGTQPDLNPSYSSHFYEQKNMEPYAGFPPFVECSIPGTDDLQPTDEQCPPILESIDDDVQDQPSSCDLGCNRAGECHSHNVFGECRHVLNWDLAPKFGEANASEVVIYQGDDIHFIYSTGGNAHNLFEMPNQESLESCNFEDSTALANVEEIRGGHTITFDQPGMYYFTCGIGCTGYPEEDGAVTERSQDLEQDAEAWTGSSSDACHCNIGQRLIVEVKDSSEGRRCHDHEQPSSTTKDDVEALSCAENEVVAYSVNNPDYGAMDSRQCAEFCTLEFTLQYTSGVEQGSCMDLGYIYAPVTETVSLEGSPVDISVRILTNESDSVEQLMTTTTNNCHCHSYEKIACPEEETAENTLYVEHIDEIEEHCQGVLDGSEDTCPYKCFQPMEVLHLHYIECPTRTVDATYIAVNATMMCHKAATPPQGVSDDCPGTTAVGIVGDITEEYGHASSARSHCSKWYFDNVVNNASVQPCFSYMYMFSFSFVLIYAWCC